MVFVFAHLVNLIKMELALTIQFVKTIQNGTVNNVLEFHVSPEHHITVDVDAVKPQSMLAQQELIGMVQDVSMLLISAQQV